jgi:hypothetical protein
VENEHGRSREREGNLKLECGNEVDVLTVEEQI